MQPPPTRYTQVGDDWIGYQVAGEGPRDLLRVAGMVSNIETQWGIPPFVRIAERLAASSRLIMFDRRGSGISDPVALEALPTWEHWTEDILAVLDAVGTEHAVILAEADGGALGLLFAATHPERTTGLVLWNVFARGTAAPDYPVAIPPEAAEVMIATLSRVWGTEAQVGLTDPSIAADQEVARAYARFIRTAMTPRAAAAQMRYQMGMDMRHVLPLIQTPTLVLHRRDFPYVPAAHGRYLADHIPGAQYAEVPGRDATLVGEGTDEIVDRIREFLAAAPSVPESDRFLATVLFTDIVGSTERAAALGDRRWREIMDLHERAARTQVEECGGRLVKTTGDGVLATFDRPGRALRCALALSAAAPSHGIEIRAGLHAGEVELRGDDVGGIAVHIAQRVQALAGPGEVLTSSTVRDLVSGSEFAFADHGTHGLKGVPGEWHLYAVER